MPDTNDFDGLIDINIMIQNIVDEIGEDNGMVFVEEMAKDFVADLLKLPKPKSKRRKATHLVDSFGYAKNKKGNGYVVGWGTYYGRMVEYGHYTRSHKSKVDAQPHMMPLWNQNQQKYFDHAVNKLIKEE